MNVKRRIGLTAVGIAVITAGIGAASCSPGITPGKPEQIRFGGLSADANVMLFAAEDRQFFTANGIDFNFITYETGPNAMQSLLNKEVDIAGSAEYPIVAQALAGANLSIIVNFDKSDAINLIGLAERGIKNVRDIKGKRIAIPAGTVLRFYFDRFLTMNGMSIADVTPVDLPPAQMAQAMVDGTIDAAVTYDPWISQIREKHADASIWRVQNNQPVYSILYCRNEWLEQHRDLVKRFLIALAGAQAFIEQDPAGAKAILQQRYGYDDVNLSRIWSQNQFGLSLDQSLIVAMEDEARWMIKNNLTIEESIPDFYKYVYLNGLTAIKPEAVNIIR